MVWLNGFTPSYEEVLAGTEIPGGGGRGRNYIPNVTPSPPE